VCGEGTGANKQIATVLQVVWHTLLCTLIERRLASKKTSSCVNGVVASSCRARLMLRGNGQLGATSAAACLAGRCASLLPSYNHHGMQNVMPFILMCVAYMVWTSNARAPVGLVGYNLTLVGCQPSSCSLSLAWLGSIRQWFAAGSAHSLAAALLGPCPAGPLSCLQAGQAVSCLRGQAGPWPLSCLSRCTMGPDSDLKAKKFLLETFDNAQQLK
jgi:hypothetical protein